MENYLPYIVSVVCALISGFASYAVARKQSREDIKKLEKTYELDLEKEKEKHKMDSRDIDRSGYCFAGGSMEDLL